jgi:hypothetical protein
MMAGPFGLCQRLHHRSPQPIDHTLELRVLDPAGCIPSETVLCLNQGRFRVQVEWEEFNGDTAVQSSGISSAASKIVKHAAPSRRNSSTLPRPTSSPAAPECASGPAAFAGLVHDPPDGDE